MDPTGTDVGSVCVCGGLGSRKCELLVMSTACKVYDASSSQGVLFAAIWRGAA